MVSRNRLSEGRLEELDRLPMELESMAMWGKDWDRLFSCYWIWGEWKLDW
jgi:hypothetical protein